MTRKCFGSVDEMLAPATLSNLVGLPVDGVRRRAFKTADSLSGSRFELLELVGQPEMSLVLKHLSWETDWLMRATNDRQYRAIVALQQGILDQLPPGLVHGQIACARNGAGWAILMDDLSRSLIPPGDDPIGEDQNERFLDMMAHFHAHFWGQTDLVDPALGFCPLESWFRALTPATGRREAGGDDPVPNMLVEAWDLLLEMTEPDIAAGLQALCNDVRPLCGALRAFPQTVVHHDWKIGNLGLKPGNPPDVVLLDWSVIGPAPALTDLGWYLAVNSARLPVSKEVAIAKYRQSLERHLGNRFDEQSWEGQLELALLGGFFLLGWSKAIGAAKGATDAIRRRELAELEWWAAPVRAGLDRLERTGDRALH